MQDSGSRAERVVEAWRLRKGKRKEGQVYKTKPRLWEVEGKREGRVWTGREGGEG